MKIYLINETGSNRYKIGITKNDIEYRIEQLQTANAAKLGLIKVFHTEFDFKVEAALHRRYKSKQTLGEWFELDDIEVNSFLDNCQKIENNFKLLELHNTYLQDKNK